MIARNRFRLLCGLIGALACLSASAGLPASVHAADNVFYYHDDALGSPVAMTNSSGTIVWQADYRPFGDLASLTDNQPNSHRFTGKEFDPETGLQYFGARFYDEGLGRFLSVDPVLLRGRPDSAIRIPQRLNLYAYSTNNPYRYIDRDGRWPTQVKRVHQAAIKRVLGDLSPQEKNVLTSQQVVIDADQSSSGAFKHAMRSPNQTPTQAWAAANDFVRNELSQARSLESGGQHEEALVHVGNAIHTLQDNTSPSHQGFQEWDENSSIESKANHVRKEFYDPGAGSALDAATKKAWNLFKSNQPIPLEVISKPEQ